MQKIDKDIFTAEVLTNISGLKRFAMSLCKNDSDSDDLVSETVLKALENYKTIKDNSKIKQWLFRILNNQFITNYRSKKKYIDFSYINNETGDNETFSLFDEISKSNFSEHGNPEKDYLDKLTRKDLQAAIEGLPDDFRESLILCDIEGFSYAQISNITNAPVGTVRSRIARARIILKKKLWMHAEELGIKKSKELNSKTEYVCNCGEEEINNSIKPK